MHEVDMNNCDQHSMAYQTKSNLKFVGIKLKLNYTIAPSNLRPRIKRILRREMQRRAYRGSPGFLVQRPARAPLP